MIEFTSNKEFLDCYHAFHKTLDYWGLPDFEIRYEWSKLAALGKRIRR